MGQQEVPYNLTMEHLLAIMREEDEREAGHTYKSPNRTMDICMVMQGPGTTHRGQRSFSRATSAAPFDPHNNIACQRARHRMLAKL
jgi:hypothetical protein